ncbi:transketolase family protein [Thermodesulfobacteriota bacterium]
MRKAFVKTLVEMADIDERILLLTGDIGYSALEPFADKFPERFLNVGVAEQNMVGLATGMAEGGYIPFVYSIATFCTMRPYEFIRNGPILHNLPVRIVGVGGGFEYGHAGATHHALEDVGIMRTQPGITVIVPADHIQTRSALLAGRGIPGPIYYRLGKDDQTTIPGLNGRFELEKPQLINDGNDLLIIAMGGVSSEAVAAAESLKNRGINSTVMIIASVKPISSEALADIFMRFKVVLTVEGHYTTGGIGSLVSEVIAEYGLGCKVVRCGIKKMKGGKSGSQNFLRHIHGISADKLVTSAINALNLP